MKNLGLYFFLALFFFLLPNKICPERQEDVLWKDVNGVLLPIPPNVHPRLYVRTENIPELTSRMSDPVLVKVWGELQAMQKDRTPEEIPAVKNLDYYFDPKGLATRVELMAMDYLINKDEKIGREAILLTLDTLEKAEYPAMSDISRAIGRLMVTGAIVYDWCYDLLKPAEKNRFVNAFVKEAKKLECGYPPVKQGSVVGHASEWMIMRDLLSVAIAVYDEFPEMYNLTAGRFFKEHLPVRNWFYKAHAYHQGMGYLNVRFGNDLFALWILDRMGAGNVYDPSQQYVLYEAIYKRRPDGQVMSSGDMNYSRKNVRAYPIASLLAGSYYKDTYINYEYQKKARVDNHTKLFEFLWRDTKLGSRKPDDLPLTKYFGTPYGWMIARTSWDDKCVIAEMKINEYNFVNHQHNDAGTFQIYYKGPLAIDAGIYQGSSGGYNSPHNKNYFKRTIAHNGLLIYDPAEKFPSFNYGGDNKTDYAVNDGGQALPGEGWSPPANLDDLLTGNFRTGTVLAAKVGADSLFPDFSYLKGDITQAYSSKVKEVKRSFVFLNFKEPAIPAAFIVYDKVVAANPDFKKYWLLHSIEKPEILNNKITIRRTLNGDKGMLSDTLLIPEPANADIVSIGGPGKEFWVSGTNYPNNPASGVDEANERGAWRVEVSPKRPSREDYFLNVMQISDNDQKSQYVVKLIQGEKLIGVQLADRITTFSKDMNVLQDSFNLTVQGEGIFKFLITDVLPAAWRIMKDGIAYIQKQEVRDGEETIFFEGTAGEYTFVNESNGSNGVHTETYILSTNIYPNPASNMLYIDLPNNKEEKTISIYCIDGSGKTEVRTCERTLNLNVSTYPEGIYLIKLRSGNNVYVTKLIKK